MPFLCSPVVRDLSSGISRRIWFDRSFDPGIPVESFPEVLERLRGTPLRAAERTARLCPDLLRLRSADRWSAQEHIGHLADLEPLWMGRISELVGGLKCLREADLENRATWDADHNSRGIDSILETFRSRREEMVERLEEMTGRELRATAMHPRLEQPMTPVDLCFFVAEHDDHHLAAITALVRSWKNAPTQ